MPSIFEKPSILGFRAEGGDMSANADQIKLLGERLAEARQKAVTEQQKNELAALEKRFAELSYVVRAEPPASVLMAGPGSMMRPPMPTLQQRETAMREIEGLMPQLEQLRNPQGSGRGASGSWEESGGVTPAPAYGGPMAAVPSGRQTPLPGLGGGAVPTATSEFMSRLLKLPTSADVPSMFDTMTENARQQQPGGTRAERVAAAIASGDFAEKQRQYNEEAMRLGQPTQMDAQGNIVGRELTEAERMREFFKTTGGNTMFSQTTDPAQRALQNEMMKQARAQATVNTFGTTPEERLANLQAETDARKILQSPLSSDVREVAPGVRAAFKDGQTVGFSTPGDGKTAPQGTITDPITGEQMPLALYNEMTRQTQATKGMTGGSPMERGLLAAMTAEEERKKKMASDAAAAALAATPPTTEAELIARTPAITIPPREKAAPKTTPPSRLTPLKDIRGSSYVDPTTGQKMIW